MRINAGIYTLFGRHSFAANALATFLLLTSTLGAGAAPEGLPQAVVPEGFGIHIWPLKQFAPNEFQTFNDVGFGFVRMDFRWASIEKTPGVYDFSANDATLAVLDRAHVRALLILAYENPLYDGGLTPHTDEGRSAFARFAAAAVKHLANRGVVWEVWNEPNAFWTPKVNVGDYGALVRATVKAIRKVDRNATILAGATSGMPLDYIESLLRSGSLDDVTALSVHPYRNSNPETAGADYASVRALIARYTRPGRPRLPIVCSEWGYSTVASNAKTPWWIVNEQRQAAYMLREYLFNLASGVNLTIFYEWNDGPDPNNAEDEYGLLHWGLNPKSSYTAAKNFIQSLRGYTFRHRLATSNPSDYELLFEGPADVALVDWSSDPNAVSDRQMPAIRKVKPGDARYSILKRAAATDPVKMSKQ